MIFIFKDLSLVLFPTPDPIIIAVCNAVCVCVCFLYINWCAQSYCLVLNLSYFDLPFQDPCAFCSLQKWYKIKSKERLIFWLTDSSSHKKYIPHDKFCKEIYLSNNLEWNEPWFWQYLRLLNEVQMSCTAIACHQVYISNYTFTLRNSIPNYVQPICSVCQIHQRQSNLSKCKI